ncbi:MAG: MraY family glycosyltransferase [Pseudomonadota bacterium]|nr:MraY family glycosyltransferase [Pseudomonadota bacterium]
MREIILPLISFFSSIFFIALLRPIAKITGLVDIPDSRKLHSDSIPLIGGIAMFFSILITVLIDSIILGSEVFPLKLWAYFFLSCSIMVFVGALDDRKGLTTAARFFFQVIVSLIMILGAGVLLSDLGGILPGGGLLKLGWFAIPFTVFTCLGVINSINMIDGLDGLSGNLILISLFGFGLSVNFWGDPGTLIAISILSASIAGFLVFNLRVFGRHRASVFMGDAGSMMFGFILAWAAIQLSQGEYRVLKPAAVLWFLMVPIYDTVTIIARRVLAGRSPLQPDAEHLHHLLLRLGFSVGQTITIICFIAIIGVLVGIAGNYFKCPEFLMAICFVFFGLIYLSMMQLAWRSRSLFGRSFEVDD